MYIKKINNELKRYSKLPEYYKNWAGNFREQSDETHKQEGFIKMIYPIINNTTHEFGDMFLDEENEVYTFNIKEKIIIPLDLEEVREQKLNEFNNTFDEFTILISRCQFSIDPSDTETLTTLNNAITIARNVKKQHLTYLKNETDVDILNLYRVREEDVLAMKQMFSQFE